MNIVFNIIANESSSSNDDELEIIIRLAIEEERSRSVILLFNAVGSLSVILCKATKGFFLTYLLNHWNVRNIDCMHWKWNNCLTAWKGSHNNINVLDRSHVFIEVLAGRSPSINYSINGYNYTMGYYLADDLYPLWSIFVKTIQFHEEIRKKKNFVEKQEATRKDVERAFGVLQARFAIIRGVAPFFRPETLKDIMMACIILHNMIIEDERHLNGAEGIDYEQFHGTTHNPVSHDHTPEFT
ncbi:uncharacterized protein LOC136069394 [Quercus suber]|uniref:uncharacterized protein LOC136069394 n=1 Tax=Quercus suber TaxID=58331 RepID=UPI0032DF314F